MTQTFSPMNRDEIDLVWYRRDLRITDNHRLFNLCEREGRSAKHLK
ncbi:MAG: hypothetical protein ACOYMQ_16820 [Pseudanabaena sp.]